jgi:A1 cistron-splicing factor AAR2
MVGGHEHEPEQRFLGLLDLPRHSSITIDGEALILKRPDFVGFVNLPAPAAAEVVTPPPPPPPGSVVNDHCQDRAGAAATRERSGGFHFVSVRAAANRRDGPHSERSSSSSVVVGFVIPHHGNLIRRYDPATEEVSPHPIDSFTEENLLRHLRDGRIDPHQVADYGKLLDPAKENSWRELTGSISPSLLRRRGLEEGDKIVPGAYKVEDDEREEESPTDSRREMDGISVAYPPLPVLLTSTGARTSRHRPLVRHAGTKRFLSRLGPDQRTALAMDPSPPTRVLEKALRDYYGGSWRDLVGDVQLSFLLFLYLHCFASLVHWRDLVTMLSCVDPQRLRHDLQDVATGALYPSLLRTLARQISAVDSDFFDDAELSGENELIPSLHRLLRMRHPMEEENGKYDGWVSFPAVSLTALRSSRARLEGSLRQRFPSQFPESCLTSPVNARVPDGVEVTMGNDSDDEWGEDDDEAGPAVVASDDVDASLARIAAESVSSATHGSHRRRTIEYSDELRGRYPLLFAAMLPTEDVVMTCARALDDANDVSLVREASDYLKQVEACLSSDSDSVDSCRLAA